MTIDRREQVREHLTHVYLAFQILARRSRPWNQQRRIASIGLVSARMLAAMLIQGREADIPENARERDLKPLVALLDARH